jgi:hypothetical protein
MGRAQEWEKEYVEGLELQYEWEALIVGGMRLDYRTSVPTPKFPVLGPWDPRYWGPKINQNKGPVS